MKLPSLKLAQFDKTLIPYAVLVGTLLLTATAAYYVSANARAKDRLRFDSAVQRAQNDIQNRLKTSINLLQASSGLFVTSKQITRDEFRSYIKYLSLREQHPGIQGIGFSVRVDSAQKDAIVAAMRQQGEPAFKIWPDFARQEYHSIIYLEPLDQLNRVAIGFDMFTEPVRRFAMERARDTGTAAASGRVTLIQEINRKKQAGFLIYIPIYQNGRIPATVAERRASLKGFVYSPLRADDFIQGIFGNYPGPYVDFQIYDGTEINPRNLLHRSSGNSGGALTPDFTVTKTLTVAGEPWSIVFTSRPELTLDSERHFLPFLLLTGALTSLILFQATRSQVKAWLAAEQSTLELRQSEKALRASEERFQTFMDNSPAAAWITDQDGVMLYLNRTYYRLFELPSSDVVGRTIHDIYPIEIADQFLENIRMVVALNKAIEAIETAPRLDGSTGEFLVYKFPIADASRRILVGGVAIDITERNQAEERLRQSEIRFRTLVEQAPVSIQILAADGKTLQVNRAWEELWGVTLEQIKDYNILEDAQLVMRGIMPYIKQGFAGETTVIPATLYDLNQTIPGVTQPNDSERWVQSYIYPVKDEVGVIREVVLMHEDITDRKQAEAELQESEARFKTLIETTFDGITINENGIILEANQGIATMFGYPMREIIGKSVLDFVAEECRDSVLQKTRLDDGPPYETTGLRKDGTTFSIEIVGKAHRYKGRKVRVSALRDISKRKQLEDQLRARAEQLAEANRLKDEFLATLSHELRTPLNAMLGWTQMLMTRKLDEKTFNRATETIDRNTRSLAQLIEDLLDVSRIITGKLHLQLYPVHLTPIIESAVEMVHSAAAAKNIQMTTDLDDTVGRVLGDSNRIQQIVWNLLANAVKFTPTNGRVEVRLEQLGSRESGVGSREESDHSPLPTPHSPTCAQITVTDTGQGISSDFLPYVFERFRQADGSTTRRHGGLGLGLAIVRHLVELQGGTVQVESLGVGQGSTFTVRLPISNASKAPQAGKQEHKDLLVAAGRSHALLHGIKILVVEDEADTRELLVKALEQFGAKVMTATTATAALERLIACQPQVLVSDIGLPDEDGYALIRKVRTLSAAPARYIPAIALTAYARAEDRNQALAAGFQVHLSKPIDVQQLATTIHHLLSSNGSNTH